MSLILTLVASEGRLQRSPKNPDSSVHDLTKLINYLHYTVNTFHKFPPDIKITLSHKNHENNDRVCFYFL